MSLGLGFGRRGKGCAWPMSARSSKGLFLASVHIQWSQVDLRGPSLKFIAVSSQGVNTWVCILPYSLVSPLGTVPADGLRSPPEF